MAWTPVEITAADQLTPDSYLLLCNLRSWIEGGEFIDGNGRLWRQTLIDNAQPKDWSARKFAGHLSDLTEKGFYQKGGWVLKG